MVAWLHGWSQANHVHSLRGCRTEQPALGPGQPAACSLPTGLQSLTRTSSPHREAEGNWNGTRSGGSRVSLEHVKICERRLRKPKLVSSRVRTLE